MHSTFALAFVSALSTLAPAVSALGINCRGSGLCHLASWESKAPEPVMQVLRDAVWQSTASNDTAYVNGDHVICVAEKQPITLTGTATYNTPQTEGGSGSLAGSFGLAGGLNTGGICLFPQYMADGASLTLSQIRPLMDKLLEHGCGTCGSVPIHFVDQGSNDPKDGILTFNYVKNPYCTEKCLSGTGGAPTAKRSLRKSVKFAALNSKQ